MRKIMSTPSIVVAIALVSRVLSAQSPNVRFSDTFSPGPSQLWSNFFGNWTANAGQYFAQVPNNNPLTYTGLPFDLTSYTLTVTVNQLADGGIWLRSTENNPSLATSIVLILGGGGYGQGTRGGNAGTAIHFQTLTGCCVNQVNGVFTPGDTYTLKITVQDNNYSVYVNGSNTPVITLADSTFKHGQVGLYDDQPNTTTGNGSGPPTTFSNFSITGLPVPPRIAPFSPTSGPVHTKVEIKGTNLQLASAVTFNGKAAAFRQEYPSTEITAAVPAGATTGLIAVITPLDTFTSATDFTVP